MKQKFTLFKSTVNRYYWKLFWQICLNEKRRKIIRNKSVEYTYQTKNMKILDRCIGHLTKVLLQQKRIAQKRSCAIFSLDALQAWFHIIYYTSAVHILCIGYIRVEYINDSIAPNIHEPWMNPAWTADYSEKNMMFKWRANLFTVSWIFFFSQNQKKSFS